MIDYNGFRPNVGIILVNSYDQVLWARRSGQEAWQFPQGGIKANESAVDALYRELHEEVGLKPESVSIIGSTKGWLRYRLPKGMIRQSAEKVCIGQKQKWFLLRMLDNDDAINLSMIPDPEFDDWRWVSYWYPINQVVNFKREVYRRAMKQLALNLNQTTLKNGITRNDISIHQ